jgi:hypothetical protein
MRGEGLWLVSMALKKKDPRVDMDVRPSPILFKNYDYTAEGPNETSPGGGLYHGRMDRFKSVKDFVNKRRKANKKLKKSTAADDREPWMYEDDFDKDLAASIHDISVFVKNCPETSLEEIGDIIADEGYLDYLSKHKSLPDYKDGIRLIEAFLNRKGLLKSQKLVDKLAALLEQVGTEYEDETP